jgi:hypothetical protein
MMRHSINVREIPRWQWPAFLERFSRTHRAWLATVDTNRETPERSDAAAHPLRSVTPFVYNHRVVHVDIRFQDDPQGCEPLRIHAPSTVRVDETTDGIEQGLEIVDDTGGATRLRFRSAPRPEMLDGVAPGEVS